ncbi:MAG: CBS domain-containing protein [Proteobacteria bacterium]|nr:CBS domain-containing protein [Pseudomonadota bacterium]
MSERTVFQSIPNKRVLTTTAEASVYDAACIMTRANCGSVIVVDADGAMAGIVTERDLMTKVVAREVDPAKTAVSEIMTKHPRFAMPETLVSQALLIMKDGGFRHLPVLAATGKIIGMFSIRDASPKELSEADRQIEYVEELEDAVGY